MSDGGVDLASSLGSGLGSLLGSGVALASTQAGISDVGNMTTTGANMVAPYNFTGANYLGTGRRRFAEYG